MKKLFIFSLFLMFFSCGKEDKVEAEVENIPVEIQIERFDKLFYESKPNQLSQLKKQYPFFFPSSLTDSILENKLKDPLLQELYQEVQQKYNNVSGLQSDITDLIKHIKFYFPKFQDPRVITLINEVDTEAKAIYTDSIALVSLDCYLGANHRFYSDFPEYQRIEFDENQILPDLVSSFGSNVIVPPSNKNFLSLMLYKGKILFLKDKLLPNVADEAKIAYTKDQIEWCKANEYQMWSYLVEQNILFETNIKNEYRFLNDAPFSKFYLEIDNESPGRVGQWLGWQIIRSYMDNNNVSLEEMLITDAQTIFENSRYKPSK